LFVINLILYLVFEEDSNDMDGGFGVARVVQIVHFVQMREESNRVFGGARGEKYILYDLEEIKKCERRERCEKGERGERALVIWKSPLEREQEV